jgi:hypothetical protein
VHSLSRLCTSIHPLRLLSAFIPSVHHVHLDRSIAPLYLLHYSTADPLNSLSTFRANPPIVHVGHYGQPTVTARPLYFLGMRLFLSTSPPYFLSTGRLLWCKASIPFKRRPTPSRSNHTPLHNLFLRHTGTEGVHSHQSRGSSIRTVFGGVPPHHLAPCGIATGSIPHHVGIHGLSLS